MPQSSERKKLVLTFLVINSEIHHLTEEEGMKYIKFNFGKYVFRREHIITIKKHCMNATLIKNHAILTNPVTQVFQWYTTQ